MIDPEQKEKFLDGIREYPNITVMATRCGISKATVFRWKKEDPDFAKQVRAAMSEGRGTITDLAEGKLIGAIKKGEKWAILEWLATHTKTYFKPRKAYPAPPYFREIKTVNFSVTPDVSPGDLEEFIRWRKDRKTILPPSPPTSTPS
jgi:hypothetical protein